MCLVGEQTKLLNKFPHICFSNEVDSEHNYFYQFNSVIWGGFLPYLTEIEISGVRERE